MRVRVLVLSWEYPPVVVGGLGRHVHAVCEAMAAAGHDVTVVTRHPGPDGPDVPFDERVAGVRVVRAPEDPPRFVFAESTLLAWTMAFNHALTRAALASCDPDRPYDVVHAHDWLVAHTAATVKHHLGVPLVATMHATEAGRHQGWLPGDVNRSIHSVEWWLTYEARRVLTCSEYMRWEVTRLFELPGEKVDTVPNGVHPADWQPSRAAVASVRSRHDLAGPVLLFSGRLVYEKGLQDLLRAMPRLKRRHPDVRLVVTGEGPYEAELRALARKLRLGRSVRWLGFVPSDELAALAAAARCAVVPSIYEPFGMVAVEAAAAGASLVLADTGGLAELADSGIAALRVQPGDVDGLVTAIDSLLTDEVRARRLAQRARTTARRSYAWPRIAERIVEIYRRAQADEHLLATTLGRTTRPAMPSLPPRVAAPEGNLLRATSHGT